MDKPLVYVDSDLAISCLMRSLSLAGLNKQAELLRGLTISSQDSALHAQRLIAGLPRTAATARVQRGALEMLAFAGMHAAQTAFVQAPIDFC